MSEDNKTDNSIEERVFRISNNFESDILRLIKTQSMIKTSGGIIDEEIEYLNSKTKVVQEKLNELNLKTNELSDLLQVTFQDKDLSSTHVGLYLNEFISSITKQNIEISSLNKELSDRIKNGSEKLSSLHKFYIAELEAYRQEVDSGLSNIREEIKEKLNEELESDVAEFVHPEEPAIPVETEETIQTEEEYYQKMFASSNVQGDADNSEDKFLYIALGFLVLCAVGFLGYYFKYIKPNTRGEMVILEELYNDKSEKSPVMEKLPEPQNSKAIENNNDIPGKLISSDKPSRSEEYLMSEAASNNIKDKSGTFNHKVLVKRANVRNGPGINYGVVSVVTYGTSVAMLEEDSGFWTKIRLKDGKEGWVAKKLLSK